MIREAIQQLVASVDLDREQASATMDEIMNGEATDIQVAGFLVALRMKGESVDEIVGMVSSMRDHATAIEAPAAALDTCGTGGAAAGTFNIAPAAALVVTGAGATTATPANRPAPSPRPRPHSL